MATQPIGGPGSQSLNDGLRKASTERSGKSGSAGNVRGTDGSGIADEASTAEATEKVQISQKARDLLNMSELMNSARKSLDETPDVRAEKIAAVKERLRAGVYETDGVRQELAHRLSGILGELPPAPADGGADGQ